ncbi:MULTISPECIES: chemotaxis protein CheW [Thiorhodovibrio]|jgi:purine-binding chemotaxis protein CheW|uniref:chemotaxis protein CheW n=1 Tax=Thiorhodovibrio TaxID=61593 RepID=UPI00191352E8|nr:MULTISPECIES: chemotaxis protein CheW [Thiorhodovibrio]MBK5970268.1 chemotaxis protein CheW [Thiorhodovibrio winogradskyi]WPL14834.1 Chemotaxis protein CheW [Thiorhodovibrio litoralis]
MTDQATASRAPSTGANDLGAGDTAQYLTFSVSEERLAMSIDAVQEIIETPRITQVPMTPDYIRGVINLRGNVVPVVDLGARLSRGALTISKRSCIVLVEVKSQTISHHLGMLVDEVNNILEIPHDDVKPAPEFGSEIRTDFIEAMGRVNDVFIIILAVDNVLSIQELASLKKLVEGASLDGPNVGS